MSFFDKFKKQNDIVVKTPEIENEKYTTSLVEMNNYMLSDVRKNDISNNSYNLALAKVKELAPIAIPNVEVIQNIAENKKMPNADKLYRVINLEENDSLKAMRDGKTFWGAIKKEDKTSTMAKLQEVPQMTLDPATMMMAVVLSNIEAELGDIKELSQKILTFLEEEKESEIESDLEILNRSIQEFKYNLNDDKYLVNNHKQVMDIRRTANKNMLFYKKQIRDNLDKTNLLTTNSLMNSILKDLEKKFKYYRLSLYIYSFSTLLEILLLGNYQSEYLQKKKAELDELDNEYIDIYNEALEYIEKNANKSLESNVLTGLGSAGKAIANLAKKVNTTKNNNVDEWLNSKGEDLVGIGQNIKSNFIDKFKEIKESNSKAFIEQIDKVDLVYNKTKEIYFDKDNIYLEYEK